MKALTRYRREQLIMGIQGELNYLLDWQARNPLFAHEEDDHIAMLKASLAPYITDAAEATAQSEEN